MPHRSHGGCPWEQSEQPGAVGGELCAIKGVRFQEVVMGGCNWFI